LSENPAEGDRVSFRFRREEHLKGRKEIREVFNKGRRYGCRGAKLFVLKNNLQYNRICFTFAKITRKEQPSWNAVSRNRARRLGRESFRLMKDRLLKGHDFILLVYPGEANVKSERPKKKIILSDRLNQLESLFIKAGLLK